MNILIVVAHPDDEALGAGGMIRKFSNYGHNIDCCILSGLVSARRNRPEVSELHRDLNESHKILGYRNSVLGDFPNIEFNTVPHLHLVQFIENQIYDCKSQIIFTHHPSDLNNDHAITAHACLAASRLWQRRPSVPRLEEIYFMEIPSSTEWSFPGHNHGFQPNTFIELEGEDLEAKISAVSAYRNVMRPTPHPRSRENLTAMARLRGSQAGYIYAEAFQRVFGVLRPTGEMN